MTSHDPHNLPQPNFARITSVDPAPPESPGYHAFMLAVGVFVLVFTVLSLVDVPLVILAVGVGMGVILWALGELWKRLCA